MVEAMGAPAGSMEEPREEEAEAEVPLKGRRPEAREVWEPAALGARVAWEKRGLETRFCRFVMSIRGPAGQFCRPGRRLCRWSTE